MRGLVRFIVIFLLFFMGTAAVVQVDRSCGRMNGSEMKITIEKYASLL